MLSLEEYKRQISSVEEELSQLKDTMDKRKPDAEKLRTDLSNAETEARSASYKMHGVKINRMWLIFLCLGIAALIAAISISVFWLKDIDAETFWDGFNHNGVPTIMVILFVLLTAAAIVFLIIKKKNVAAIQKEIDAANALLSEAKAANDAFTAETDALTAEKTGFEQKKRDLQNAMYADYPEELQKIRDAKEAEKQRALDELRREEEINLRAAEEAKRKQENFALGQKMFDHPQAYILDGQYENEYQVFCAAAELGCEDAQIRVCEILLGIVYKNGVKPDPAAGEETALRYAAGGTNALYEILGKAYLYGEGDVKKDEEKALRYLEKASSKGRQKAMIMAAICHYNGVGTEKNEQRARYYFERAAKQGNEQAIRVVMAMDNGEKLRF